MRRFSRSRAPRPARAWQDLSAAFVLTTQATSTSVNLLEFQAPAAGSLTAMPPEDVTVLRVVGDFTVQLSAAVCSWTLGLMVADSTWTPGATFVVDSDKRVLWHRTYTNFAGTGTQTWVPPGLHVDGTGTPFPDATRAGFFDITPKVRLEQGKALKLVAWENAGAGTVTVSSVDMRALYQRSRRR